MSEKKLHEHSDGEILEGFRQVRSEQALREALERGIQLGLDRARRAIRKEFKPAEGIYHPLEIIIMYRDAELEAALAESGPGQVGGESGRYYEWPCHFCNRTHRVKYPRDTDCPIEEALAQPAKTKPRIGSKSRHSRNAAGRIKCANTRSPS